MKKKIDRNVLIAGIALIVILAIAAYILTLPPTKITKKIAIEYAAQRTEEGQIAEQLSMILENSGQCKFEDFFRGITPLLASDGVLESQMEELKPQMQANFESYMKCSPKLRKEGYGENGPTFLVNYYFTFPEGCRSTLEGEPVISVRVDGNNQTGTIESKVVEAEIFQGSAGKFTEDIMKGLGPCT